MKYLWLSLFSIICLLSVHAQTNNTINGTRLSDWQNTVSSACYPDNFTINIVNATTTSIVYYFSNATLEGNCKTQNYNDSSMTGSLSPSANSTTTWTDFTGSTLTYNAATNTISYDFLHNNVSFLYSVNGALFSQQAIAGTLGATWNNPVQNYVNPNTTTCCVPDSITTTPGNDFDFTGSYNFTTSNCSTSSSTSFAFSMPNSTIMLWYSVTQATLGNTIIISPATSLTQMMWTYVFNTTNNSTNVTTLNVCSYNFSRVNPSLAISGSWLLDWQSTKPVPTAYTITTTNTSNSIYMTSAITLSPTATVSSYVLQMSQGQYYDSYSNGSTYPTHTWTYDQPSNTLLDPTNQVLLSPTGSLFSSAPFVGTWNTPTALSNTSLPSDCCVPTSIIISNNGTGPAPLQVAYQLPTNFANITGCVDLNVTEQINNNQLLSTLIITTPRINQLVWTDPLFHNTIFFTNSSVTSQVSVSGLSTSVNGTCGFSMQLFVPPVPPPPKPLSSSLVSTGIMSLVVGLFLMLAL